MASRKVFPVFHDPGEIRYFVGHQTVARGISGARSTSRISGSFNVAARILIADDNALVRRALRRVLEQAGGWQILEAGNGKEAVEKAKQTAPDLVILDLAMPEMDGFASTREISKLLPGVPILLHTLYWSPRVALEALKAGARKAIPKSQSNAVIEAVHELLAPRAPRLLVLLQRRLTTSVVAPIHTLAESPPASDTPNADPLVLSEKADGQAPDLDVTHAGNYDAAPDAEDAKGRKIS
jgi:two-component system, chemotaxis family, chemotaxis protein CheY